MIFAMGLGGPMDDPNKIERRYIGTLNCLNQSQGMIPENQGNKEKEKTKNKCLMKLVLKNNISKINEKCRKPPGKKNQTDIDRIMSSVEGNTEFPPVKPSSHRGNRNVRKEPLREPNRQRSPRRPWTRPNKVSPRRNKYNTERTHTVVK